jgi:hypothetical protein
VRRPSRVSVQEQLSVRLSSLGRIPLIERCSLVESAVPRPRSPAACCSHVVLFARSRGTC